MSQGKTPKRKDGAGRPASELDREDALLWQAITEGMEKLPGREVQVPEADSPKPSGRRPATPRTETASVPKAPPQPLPAPLAVGDFAGVDRRTADRLRRGKLPIDADLDLHGCYQDEAQRLLTEFVLAQAERGARCLLVVTGKGSRSESGRGVLREGVPRWLSAPPLRPLVLAITHAIQPHGGTGAYYILLKRKRG